MKKDVFVDGHKRSNVMENWKKFLNKIEELKSYLVEFDENSKMKNKIYPLNCTIGVENRWLIIVITPNKCIFSRNDGIHKTWTRIRNIFLHLKG